MKKIYSLLFFVLAILFTAHADEWLNNFSTAQQNSVLSGKPILVYIAGTGWDPWSKKMDEEVFETQEFKKYAQENLILFRFDCLKKGPYDDPIKNALYTKLNIHGVPVCKLIDPKGGIIKKYVGYQRGGPDQFILKLQSALKNK